MQCLKKLLPRHTIVLLDYRRQGLLNSLHRLGRLFSGHLLIEDFVLLLLPIFQVLRPNLLAGLLSLKVCVVEACCPRWGSIRDMVAIAVCS